MLIGLGYKKRSGKDTVGKFIQVIMCLHKFNPSPKVLTDSKMVLDFYEGDTKNVELYSEVPIKSFADRLKKVTSELVDIPIEELEALKNDPNSIFPIKYKEETISYRKALQVIGSELFRDNFNNNIWVDLLLQDCNNTIITDVRFPNEADAIKAKGGIVVLIDRPKLESTDDHSSETAMEGYNWDYTIYNSGNLNDLLSETNQFLKIKKFIL